MDLTTGSLTDNITMALPTGVPIEIDLGCARGHFLEAMAQRYPHRFFLGIERLRLRYEKTLRRIKCCSNATVWHAESQQAIEMLLPKLGINTIYISFPDPWPKRRHHNRRLITVEFLQKCLLVLAPQGFLRFMTDHRDYFCAVQAAVKSCGGFVEEGWGHEKEELPLTEFQKRFIASGDIIYRLALRKV